MGTSYEHIRQMREAAQRRASGAGETFEFDAKVKVTVNPGRNGASLLASSIVLEDLGIRLHGFRMNCRDGKLVPFFPGQNQDESGNRSLDIRIDAERAPFDLIVLANEKERRDPKTGQTYRARVNIPAVAVNGGRLALAIVDRYCDAVQRGDIPVGGDYEEMRDLADTLAAEA